MVAQQRRSPTRGGSRQLPPVCAGAYTEASSVLQGEGSGASGLDADLFWENSRSNRTIEADQDV